MHAEYLLSRIRRVGRGGGAARRRRGFVVREEERIEWKWARALIKYCVRGEPGGEDHG